MKICPSCGIRIEDDAAITCPGCGASLSAGGSRFARRSRVARPERAERPARPVRPTAAQPADPAEAPAPSPAPAAPPAPVTPPPAAPETPAPAPAPETPSAPAEPAHSRFARPRRAAAPAAPAAPAEPAAPVAPAAPAEPAAPAAPAQPVPPAPAPEAPAAPAGPTLAESGQPARIVTTPEEAEARAGEKKKRLLLFLVIAAVAVVAAVAASVIGSLAGSLAGGREDDGGTPQSSSSAVSEPVSEAASDAPASAPASDSAASDDFEWEATAQNPVEENVPSAVASDTEVVFRNAKPNAALYVDGSQVTFTYVGSDAVVSRDALPDICQVRIVAPTDAGYETAAVWYNYRYGNDMTFGDDYGAYVESDETGLGEPGAKVVDVLTWAYYSGYLRCINDQTLDYMAYSTDSNTVAQAGSIFSDANAKHQFNTDDFQAVCDPESIQYKNGRVRYNATFVSNRTNRSTGEVSTGTNHRTIELVWEDGVWKVNRTALLSDEDFAARRYAELP